MSVSAPKIALLHRMVMPGHTCPYGLKARHLLRSHGYKVEDHPLRTQAETDGFKAEHDVRTTPQAFIGGERIGGFDDLRRFFGQKVRAPGATSYTPVLAVFAVAAMIALAVNVGFAGGSLARGVRLAISFAMCLLAMLKLQDVATFSTMFLNYDLLARRWVPYGSLYPVLELGAGLLMTADVLPQVSIPDAAVIGTIGAVSVFKAVYIDKRELKCACVGGSSPVPLGFVSLIENVLMVGMAVWMAIPTAAHA